MRGLVTDHHAGVREGLTPVGRGGAPPHDRLSKREFQVLVMIAQGRTVTQIGDELHLSVKTISTYRTRLLDKMGLKTNAEVARYASGEGLVS